MIFITGANGFLGKNLCEELQKRQLSFKAGSRELYGDLAAVNNWQTYLKDCTSVIHLAARVHIMDEVDSNPLEAFRKVNVDVTVKLATAAKELGIKKFIFVSSIKVNGEETFEKPFSSSDKPHPQDPYGISKMEAENELLKLHMPGVFEVTIIRPPLIYGKGVKANFKKLFWLVEKDLPIPFGLVKNHRSLVSVLNIVDLIITCLKNDKAAGEIFLVSDGRDYSLRELILEMGKSLNKTPHLLPISVSLMKLSARVLGKKSYADRLFGNLHVDIKKTQERLDWNPPYNFQDTFKDS